MRGRVAKAYRRLRLASEKPGDAEIIERAAIRFRARSQPKPVEQRVRKTQISADKIRSPWGRTCAPIIANPLRKLRAVAAGMELSLGQYVRLKTEHQVDFGNGHGATRYHLRGENHAGAQPKWLLDRMAATA